MEKTVTFYSYYSPEEITGIGKYNGEMIDFLHQKGAHILSFSNAPFYPFWRLYDKHKNTLYSKRSNSIIDVRSWVYIPKAPGALKKIISELSFTFSSTLAIIRNLKSVKRSSLIIVINPPFFLGAFPILIGKIYKIPVLFHIQDLQVDAARELGLLPVFICDFLEFFERQLLNSAKYISTISLGMREKLERKKLNRPILMAANWSNLDEIVPGQSYWLHEQIGKPENLKLIVYSGNVGEKQGLEIVLEAAKALELNKDIHFVILGAGLYLDVLKQKAEDLNLINLTFHELVPKERLLNMLQSSFLQLVIQKSVGADSFLPSKLTNILAAGCASIVTAEPGTSLYTLMTETHAAKVIRPDNASELVFAIKELLSNDSLLKETKVEARNWAENNLKIDVCLKEITRIIESK